MTIKDIAQRAGYAVGTVSRVLNGHPDVSDEARAKILAVVAETGFQPNDNARHLKQRESSSIAVIVKGARNLLFAGILEEIQSRVRAAGRAAAVYYLDEDDDEVEQAVRVCRELKPLGILFLGGNQNNFADRFERVTCPCVLVTTRADTMGFQNLSSVSTDDAEGAAQAIRRLIEAGHRRIGVIGGHFRAGCGRGGANTSQTRFFGCRRGFLEAGVPFDEELQFQAARFSMPGGYEAANALLERCPDLTALFAMSDVMAIGALRAIRDRGLRVPEDISLIGYDGIEQAGYCVPRLATVRQRSGRLARRSVEILLRQAAGGGGAVHEIVPFQLLPGESIRDLNE